MAFRNSWHMMKTSARVLRSRKELAVFPIISGAVSVVVAASFIVPIVLTARGGDDFQPTTGTYLLTGLFYLVSAYVTIFFNAALISQADVALKGGDPSVADGLKVAGSKWLRILPWAVLSATVSQLIRVIQDRLGFLGSLIGGVAGLAWQVVTFLVLPKLVLEDRGVVEAIKGSAASLKRTWGENLVGNAGLGVFGFLAALPAFGLFALGVKLGGSMLFVLIGLGVLWLLAVAIVIAALSGIYQTALYRFATDGQEPPSFAGSGLGNAFATK